MTYLCKFKSIKNDKKSPSILLKLTTCDVKLIDLVFSFPTSAGLRKSFRLSQKDSTSQQVRQKMGKGHAGIHLPIYQEVMPYKRKPDEPYRFVLLTGENDSCLKKIANLRT